MHQYQIFEIFLKIYISGFIPGTCSLTGDQAEDRVQEMDTDGRRENVLTIHDWFQAAWPC